jgi:hypothetical protein
VPTIEDTTKADLVEVESTGTHQGGDKLLFDLKKRKLIAQK